MSQITTHILDTALGKPARGIEVILFEQSEEIMEGNASWRQIALGSSDQDGRISDLLKKDAQVEPGIYKIRFETQEYFNKLSCQTFYPYVEIIFRITNYEHYHIPLLLNPFGYSTYRGT
jgi:5-hydroxyisourate hydrolase